MPVYGRAERNMPRYQPITTVLYFSLYSHSNNLSEQYENYERVKMVLELLITRFTAFKDPLSTLTQASLN
jgi:hypothetical protein